MSPRYFDEKDPGETVVLTFDFTKDLNGETIAAPPVVAVTVYTGADASPAAILDGAAQLDGTAKKVLQSVQAGLAPVDYRLQVTVDTSAGRTLVMAMTLPVRTA